MSTSKRPSMLFPMNPYGPPKPLPHPLVASRSSTASLSAASHADRTAVPPSASVPEARGSASSAEKPRGMMGTVTNALRGFFSTKPPADAFDPAGSKIPPQTLPSHTPLRSNQAPRPIQHTTSSVTPKDAGPPTAAKPAHPPRPFAPSSLFATPAGRMIDAGAFARMPGVSASAHIPVPRAPCSDSDSASEPSFDFASSESASASASSAKSSLDLSPAPPPLSGVAFLPGATYGVDDAGSSARRPMKPLPRPRVPDGAATAPLSVDVPAPDKRRSTSPRHRLRRPSTPPPQEAANARAPRVAPTPAPPRRPSAPGPPASSRAALAKTLVAAPPSASAAPSPSAPIPPASAPPHQSASAKLADARKAESRKTVLAARPGVHDSRLAAFLEAWDAAVVKSGFEERST